MARRRPRRRVTALVLCAALTAVTATACGSSGSGTGGSTGKVTEEQIQEALQKPTELTVWTWSASLPDIARAFEKKYPKIKVKVENVGTGPEHYTKLQNALKAGKGAPDLATVEYSAIPQFALAGELVDLGRFGFDDLESTFTPATWNAVKTDGKLYELPLNAGPMALFYNKKVFDAHGIAVPTTWDEYLDAARDLHKADPKTYIAADNGNAGLTESLIRAAGGTPFSAEGDKVGIDLEDAGSRKFAASYQPLIDEKLLSPVAGWSTEWYKGLASGNIATLLSGAWMAGTLESGVPDGAGDWRVAPLPDFGGKESATNGGGSFAMMKQSDHQLAAAALQRFISVEEGADIAQRSGSFPARAAVLSDPDFVGRKSAYFGGQEINRVFADSLAAVREGWQFLPYDVYAGNIFNDQVGKAFTGGITLQEGLRNWQDALVKYGKSQGFTVG
ncbi:ABC transporter substrate-binding protein [Streptomyces sp. NPDC091281]|uniref:ABC transporter substrate-binding protein n=1 Tax=Streptomyces sp. NPDC091281 TaxID=3365985 RepID=UPI0037FF9361